MRLLHFDEANKVILTNFSGKAIPPYAILSHRWSKDEVLFEDVRDNSYSRKTEGKRKIDFCAAQAARDGLQYFWIDTCCIDKWRLRELSAAINSTYGWYRDAARCYVFLPDVSIPAAAAAAGAPKQSHDWEGSFRTSEWFTRGWTLQELIAPASIEFFSSQGHRLGDKRSLAGLLCEITGIPAGALQGCPLERFSVSERMGWAKSRRTTEPEDEVYCLLGILDVRMSTSYGEGAEKALRRLRDELDSSAPSIIPFSRNGGFVGREAQLAELEANLFQGGQPTVVAITGEGGTGKSQLALELAYATRERDKSCAVFWIDAGDKDSLDQAFVRIAEKLRIPGWDIQDADIKILVRQHLSNRGSGKKWMLVFDNADDIGPGPTTTSSSPPARLADYLPRSELGTVVLTTTSDEAAKMLAKQHVVELQRMTPGTASRMLEKHISAHMSASEKQEMNLLLEQLSYLPLAIAQAAAYIKLSNTTLKDYRARLNQKGYGSRDIDRGLDLDKHQTINPISATLSTSLDKIRQTHPLAAESLFLIACVDRSDIPLLLLGTAAASPFQIEDAVGTLSRYALATRRPGDSSLDVHRLVHVGVREWLRERRWLRGWTEKAIEHSRRVFPDNQHGNRSKWRRLVPHAKYVPSSGLVGRDDAARTELAWRCAIVLSRDGRWKEAEELFRQVMEARKRVFGEEHPSTLTSMDHLASTYRDQGLWQEAEELQMRVMEARKREFGEEHPFTLTSVGHLALTYRSQGRWKEAEELQRQVMEARKRVLGEEHPSTLTGIAHLASTYRIQGRWREAEELQVVVMEVRKRVLGDEHPSTLTGIAHLVSTYRDQGRWSEAEELGVQAMEARGRVLGEEHPSTLSSKANLASTYRSQGRRKEAEEAFLQVMETQKRALGERHPDTLTSMANLAFTLRDLGRRRDSLEMITSCAILSSEALGAEHPNTVSRRQWKRDLESEEREKSSGCYGGTEESRSTVHV